MTGPAINTCLTFEMAVDAALHAMNASLADSVHFGDVAVACLASYLGRNVPLVAEINEVRQIIDFNPLDRPALLPEASQLLDFRLLFSNILVAAHTKLHGRYPRDHGFAGVDMTIEAVNLVVACM